MGFVVEDGTGKADANSYCTVADFLLYWLDRNVDFTDFDLEVIQPALMDATSYLDLVYQGKWKGVVKDDVQSLSFPRTGMISSDGRAIQEHPRKLKEAVYFLAKKSLAGDVLWPNPERDPTVKRKKEQLGPLIEETEYDTTRPMPVVPMYPLVDAIIKDLLDPARSSSGVSKAIR